MGLESEDWYQQHEIGNDSRRRTKIDGRESEKKSFVMVHSKNAIKDCIQEGCWSCSRKAWRLQPTTREVLCLIHVAILLWRMDHQQNYGGSHASDENVIPPQNNEAIVEGQDRPIQRWGAATVRTICRLLHLSVPVYHRIPLCATSTCQQCRVTVI